MVCPDTHVYHLSSSASGTEVSFFSLKPTLLSVKWSHTTSAELFPQLPLSEEFLPLCQRFSQYECGYAVPIPPPGPQNAPSHCPHSKCPDAGLLPTPFFTHLSAPCSCHSTEYTLAKVIGAFAHTNQSPAFQLSTPHAFPHT